MKLAFTTAFLLTTIFSSAQFSAYDPFNDNSNTWITLKNDSALFDVTEGKLDMRVSVPGDYINAKEAVVDLSKNIRCEINTGFMEGGTDLPYGICWAASDVESYHLFYITASGKYGFKTKTRGVWTEKLAPAASFTIHAKEENWLRISSVKASDGKEKLVLCINEVIVNEVTLAEPFGPFFGVYIGGKGRIQFDDFIVYQRGNQQEEFEPADLSLSLSCKSGQFRYTNKNMGWSCCVLSGCRVDEDSLISRFWYSDMRAGDYSVLVAPFEAASDGDFVNAVQRDFVEYIKDTADPIIPIRAEKAFSAAMGNETQVVQAGQVYTAAELSGNMYIRRYYVNHPFGKKSGLMFQFIVPENSLYIPVLDELVRQVIVSLEFR
jgi:hypothetical protein